MIAPMKYAMFCILYHTMENGIWEYEIYEQLKKGYSRRSLVKVREILVELRTKAWTEEIDVALFEGELVRKYKLEERHKKFIEYMLPNPKQLLLDAHIDPATF